MKIVALVALAFALANSATTNIVKPWGYGRHGMLFPGAIQTPWYMPNIERQRDSNILFLGKKTDLPESRQLNYYQDNGMTVPQQEMKDILFETEQLLQQTRCGRLDIDRAENLVSHLSEKMVQRLEEIEETLLQQAIQQISQDKLNLLMDQEFEMVQHIVKERATTVLREIAERMISRKIVSVQNTEKEFLKMSLQTVLAVQLLNQCMQQKESFSTIEKTRFMNEVEQVLEQTIIDDLERAVAESVRKLKLIESKIQLANQQLQKVKLHETINRQQTETIKIVEKVKQQVLQNLQELKINEMAHRMATISLRKLLVTRQYRMQQISFQQVGNMDDMMMEHFTMQMMQ